MKIGILTFHTPINYGAILQAWALQRYLKNEYPNASIKNVDFKTNEHIRKYNILLPFRRNIILYFYHQFCIILRYFKLKERKKKFEFFLEEEFSLTKRYPTEKSLLTNFPEMDFCIVGSDQVFHPNSPYINVYYLNFKYYKLKKIAYAPSFGMSAFDDTIVKKIKPFLEEFDALSCREKDGSIFMEELLKRKVPIVADPVFLLTKEEWRKMAIAPKENSNYIFVYDLNGGYKLLKIAKKIKKVTGLKIICQTQTAHHFYFIDKQLYSTGPKEFVGYLNNADYVVTDSFHGTAFSILLNKKQFIYIASPQASTRIRSIMDIMGLSKNIIENNQADHFCFSPPQIMKDQDLLNKLISESKNYLKNSLS